MTLVHAIVLAAATQPSPADLLRQVQDHYRNLNTFSMQIQHQDSSGQYPGRYTQRLRWRHDGRFELTTTSGENRKVPEFYADGRQVIWLRPGGQRTAGELVPGRNSMPGWEVSGGPIMSWLQDTPTGRVYIAPGGPLRWSYGPRTHWKGHPVRELVGKVTAPGRDTGISMFVEPKRRLLIGFENRSQGSAGRPGWALYTDQRINPRFDRRPGDVPVHGSPGGGVD